MKNFYHYINDNFVCVSRFSLTIVIWLSLFFFHTIFISRGIDLLDTGYHLTHQVASVKFPIIENSVSPWIFLSDFVGGLWLIIIGTPDLFLVKLGGILLFSLNGALVFLLLSRHFNKLTTFIVVITCSIFLTIGPELFTINYYTFPALVFTVWLLLLDYSIFPLNADKYQRIIFFLLGICTTILIFSKISLSPIVLMIIPIYMYFRNYQKEKTKIFVISFLVGFLVFFLIILWFYYSIDLLSNMINSIFSPRFSSDTYYFTFIFSYSSEFLKIISGSISLILSLFLMILSLQSFHKYSFMKNTYCLHLYILTISILDFIILLKIFHSPLSFLLIAIGLCVLYSVIFLLRYRRNHPQYALLIFLGLFIMAISFFGSNSGLSKAHYGMWVVLPFTLLLLKSGFKITDTFSVDSKYLFKILLCILFISAVFFHIQFFYHDSSFFNLTEKFTHPSLNNIFSTPHNVDSIDPLLYFINNNTQSGDLIVAINGIPLIYYLTETKPYLVDPVLVWYPEKEILLEYQKRIRNNEYPKIFIYKKGKDYGNSNLYAYFKNEFISNLSYIKVFENGDFIAYKKPDLLNS